MTKVIRKIVTIDEDKCTGCGDCITGCPEQAIQIIDGKAKLVKDFYCDGLGACLGTCPVDAISLEEREADPYDDDATIERIKEVAPEMLDTHIEHIKAHSEPGEDITNEKPVFHGCPSSRNMTWDDNKKDTMASTADVPSQLRQWPIQLHLVSPMAPFLQNADLLIVADCVPFAYGNFHQEFLKGKQIVIGCPKLDDVEEYRTKLTQMFQHANIKSIEIVHMEVPCCFGLKKVVHDALADSGKKIPVKEVVIGIKGDKK